MGQRAGKEAVKRSSFPADLKRGDYTKVAAIRTTGGSVKDLKSFCYMLQSVPV